MSHCSLPNLKRVATNVTLGQYSAKEAEEEKKIASKSPFGKTARPGLWLCAMNVQFRDVRYTIPFITQFWMFTTPIAYPSTLIESDALRALYGVNPMTGVVEGLRWALLGTNSAPGPMILVSAAVAVTLLVTGAFYFRRLERSFADVV